MHADCIKKALGISGMATEVSSWRKVADDKQRGGQIDLVIKRADRIVHLCEMKFSKSVLSEMLRGSQPHCARLGRD